MTTKQRTRYEVLLEDLKKDVSVIAEGHGTLDQANKRTQRDLEQRSDEADRRFMKLEVKVMGLDAKVIALDAKVDALDAKVIVLDAKFDRKFDTLDAKLSRIATHLGLDGAPQPPGRL